MPIEIAGLEGGAAKLEAELDALGSAPNSDIEGRLAAI